MNMKKNSSFENNK